MGDGPVRPFTEEEHLVFPRIRAQGPAATEDDRLTVAQVL
jgi:hypothetical protein